MDDDRLWATEEVAAYFGVSRRTLYHWRAVGQAPPALKVGRHLRWSPSALRDWQSERLKRQRSAA